MLRLVLRFDDPRSGQVLLNGHDVRDLAWGSLRGSIGYVAQDVFNFAGSIADNIVYRLRDETRDEVREGLPVQRLCSTLSTRCRIAFDSFVGECASRFRVASASALP